MNQKEKFCLIVFIAVILLLAIGLCGKYYKGTASKYKVVETFVKDTKLKKGEYVFNNNGKKITYKSVYLVDGKEVTLKGGLYESSNSDETVFLVVNGGKLNINGAVINKTGDTKGKKISDVNGINAAIVCLGVNSKVYIKNSKITTTANNSPAYYTADESNVRATNNIITTNNINSPLFYSKSNIITDKITGTSLLSNSIVVEDGNNILVNNSKITNNKLSSIFNYSKELDKTNIKSKFIFKNSTIENNSDDYMFYFTNVVSNITINNMKFTNKNNLFIKASVDNYGTKNKNGAYIDMEGKGQKFVGDMYADGLSTISLRIKEKSSYKGNTSGSVGILRDPTSNDYSKKE